MRRFLLVLVVLLAGCGSDGNGDKSSSGTGTSTGETVELVATDFKFDQSTVNVDAAGTATFRLTNDGGTTHALEIEGNGVEEETDKIGPGKTAEVAVDLKAGKYEFYCPVSNHRSLGMEGTLVVGGQAAAGGGATTNGETETNDDDGAYGG